MSKAPIDLEDYAKDQSTVEKQVEVDDTAVKVTDTANAEEITDVTKQEE